MPLSVEREYKDYGATTYPIGGKDFVSVSSVLGRWHSYGMERMKLRLVGDYARRMPNLDVDAVIGVAMKDGGEAARHGKEVHSLLERFDLDGHKGDNDWEQKHIETWANYLSEYDLKIIESEVLLANTDLGYAGRTDRICHHPTYGWVIVDVKTGKMTLEHVLQLAAYGKATHRVADDGTLEPIVDRINPDWGIIVSLPRDDTKPHVYVASLQGAFDAFKHLLGLHNYETDRRRAAGRPWQEMSRIPKEEMSLDSIVAALNAEAVDAVEQYLDDSWAWLRAVVRTYSQRERDALAERWPVGANGDPVPTFKAVANGTARPCAADIEQVELAMVDVDATLKIDFRDVLTRPIPPKDATLEECPPIHFRIDAPHPQRVAEVTALYNKLTPKEKKAFKGPKTTTRPRIPERKDIPVAVAEIEQIIASRNQKEQTA